MKREDLADRRLKRKLQYYRLNKPFCRGFLYLFNLSGRGFYFSFLRKSDMESLNSDWNEVGDDIRDSLNLYKFGV